MNKGGRPKLPESLKRSHNVTIRMRSGVIEQLKQRAEQNGRSLSAEIENRLMAGLYEEWLDALTVRGEG